MACLRQAVAAGYQDRQRLERDAALDPLRSRADFPALLRELDPKGPAKP
jgi:hypothetical protein